MSRYRFNMPINRYIWSALLLTLLSCNLNPRSIYIVPEGFEGVVLIVYEVDSGALITESDEGMVYNIPETGILEVQNKRVYGTSRPSRYYMKDSEGIIELHYDYPAIRDGSIPMDQYISLSSTYGEAYKPWLSFVVRKAGNKNLIKDRQAPVFEYLERYK